MQTPHLHPHLPVVVVVVFVVVVVMVVVDLFGVNVVVKTRLLLVVVNVLSRDGRVYRQVKFHLTTGNGDEVGRSALTHV